MTKQAPGSKPNFKLDKESLEIWGTPEDLSKALVDLETTIKNASKAQTKVTFIFGIPMILFILGAVTWTVLESGKHEGPIADHVDGRYFLYALGGFFAWVVLGLIVSKVLEIFKPHQNSYLRDRKPTVEKFHRALVRQLPSGSDIRLKWSLLPFRSGAHTTVNKTLPKEGFLGAPRRQEAWEGSILEGELNLPDGTHLMFGWSYNGEAIAVYEERDYYVGRHKSRRTDWFYDSDFGHSTSHVSTVLPPNRTVSDFGQGSAPQGKPDSSMVWDFHLENQGRTVESKLSANKFKLVELEDGLPLNDLLAHLNWVVKECQKR